MCLVSRVSPVHTAVCNCTRDEGGPFGIGNHSALEWILDQYRENTPRDPTICEKFNTYRFADHKEKVIGLLKRVTRVPY